MGRGATIFLLEFIEIDFCIVAINLLNLEILDIFFELFPKVIDAVF